MNPAVCGRRLYDWESAFGPPDKQGQLPIRALRRLAARVARDHHRAAPLVVAGRGWAHDGSLYSYNEGGRVVLKRTQRTKWVLLHELAHWLQGERGYDHGPAFARRFINLLVRYGGFDRLYLEMSAVATGVKL